VDIITKPTCPAQTARHQRMKNDLVSLLQVLDTVADLIYPAGILYSKSVSLPLRSTRSALHTMTNAVRQLDLRLLLPLSLQNMQICTAYSCCTDLDNDIQRALQLRLLHIVHTQIFMVANDTDSFHLGGFAMTDWLSIPTILTASTSLHIYLPTGT
jgi:hypothetical protein